MGFPVEHRLCDYCGQISVLTEEGRTACVERALKDLRSGVISPDGEKISPYFWFKDRLADLTRFMPLPDRLKVFTEFVMDGRAWGYDSAE
jgi:hypothetical protein